MAGDGGEWLREQMLILAESGAAPLGWWIDIPITELRLWIDTHNRVMEKRRGEQKA